MDQIQPAAWALYEDGLEPSLSRVDSAAGSAASSRRSVGTGGDRGRTAEPLARGGLPAPNAPLRREGLLPEKTQALAVSLLDEGLVRAYRGHGTAAVILAGAIGAIALFGWFAGIPILTSLHSGWVAIKANTALCLVLAAAAALSDPDKSRAQAAIARCCAALVAVTGLLTAAEYLLGANFGIDELLVAEHAAAGWAPGRMSPQAAVSYALLGSALLARLGSRRAAAFTPFVLLSLLAAFISLTGYLLHAEEFYTLVPGASPISFPADIGFLLLGSGLLLIEKRGPVLRGLASPHPGGAMLRRLLPIMLSLPVAIVWVRTQGAASGWFADSDFASAFVAVSNVTLTSALLLWSAGKLDRSDAARQRSERHRTEAREMLARIVDHAHEAIFSRDLDGVITSWNKSAERLYGYRTEEIVGRNVGALAPPNHSDEVPALIARVAAGEELDSFETERVTKSGQRVNVLLTLSPIRGDDGAITGISTIALDITERKRAEEKLQAYQADLERRTAAVAAANEKLEAANKELEAFSYSVSHDLRTPLRAIDGFSRILLEDHADKLDEEGRRVLNVVREGTVKMSHLIDDILAFSRIGRAEMKPEPVDMVALVHALLAELLAPALAARTVAVDIGTLPPAQGDRAMFERVWTNLLDNAIKFTAPKPDARIDIRGAAGKDETVYSVRDNGVGFEMQYAGKLFGVFQRLHGAEFPGTGIGLAIVKRIVARHGGRVWAESKPGEGATFYFALPNTETSHA